MSDAPAESARREPLTGALWAPIVIPELSSMCVVAGRIASEGFNSRQFGAGPQGPPRRIPTRGRLGAEQW